MHKRLIQALAIAFLAVSGVSTAAWDPGAETDQAITPYLAVGASLFNAKASGPDGSSDDFESSGFTARLGVEVVEENFFIETRFAGSLAESGEPVSVDGGDYEIAIYPDRLWGVYAIPRLPVTQSIGVYGVLGYSQVGMAIDRKDAAGGDSTFYLLEDERSAVGYGAGADVAFSHQIGGYIEYMQYLDEDDGKLNALSVGLTFNY